MLCPNRGLRTRSEGKVLRQSYWVNRGLESTMGCQRTTENRILFAGFYQDLVISGSRFPHKRLHKNRGYHSKMLQKIRLTISRLDVDVVDPFWRYVIDTNDHHLLTANIHHKIESIKRNRDEAPKKFDVNKLSDPAIREQFLNFIRESQRY